jgi:hypothetical protein
MRTKVTRSSPETALLRVLDALAQELIEASDEELQEIALALRMDLAMPESAAWAGVTYFARPRLDEFFDVDPCKKLPEGH